MMNFTLLVYTGMNNKYFLISIVKKNRGFEAIYKDKSLFDQGKFGEGTTNPWILGEKSAPFD